MTKVRLQFLLKVMILSVFLGIGYSSFMYENSFVEKFNKNVKTFEDLPKAEETQIVKVFGMSLDNSKYSGYGVSELYQKYNILGKETRSLGEATFAFVDIKDIKTVMPELEVNNFKLLVCFDSSRYSDNCIVYKKGETKNIYHEMFLARMLKTIYNYPGLDSFLNIFEKDSGLSRLAEKDIDFENDFIMRKEDFISTGSPLYFQEKISLNHFYLIVNLIMLCLSAFIWHVFLSEIIEKSSSIRDISKNLYFEAIALTSLITVVTIILNPYIYNS